MGQFIREICGKKVIDQVILLGLNGEEIIRTKINNLKARLCIIILSKRVPR
jgi:hypothetical protein